TRLVLASGPITANLQNEYDVSINMTGTPTFVAPTVAATAEAIQQTTPVFDSTTLGNPLLWSLQGVVPNPTGKDAYPIAGFTWIDLYTCYNSPVNMSQQVKSILYTLYAGGPYEAILNDNGFAMVPYVWLNEAYLLLGDVNLA